MFALSPCVVLEAVFPYRRLNTLLLLHFIITVAILAVTVRTFIPFIRVKSNCKVTTVYTQMSVELNRIGPPQVGSPIRICMARFGMCLH